MSYLVNASGRRYRYQRKIPRAIRWCWKQASIIVGLGTNNKRVAEKMISRIDELIEGIFADCKLRLITPTEAREKIMAAIDLKGTKSGEQTLTDVAKLYEKHKGERWNDKGKSEFWAAINEIQEFAGNRVLRLVDDGLLTQVRDKMRTPICSQGTVNKKLSRASAVFSYAVKKRLIQYNPVPGVMYEIPKNVKKQAAYKPYSDDDIKYIFETMLEHPGKPRWCTYMYWLPLLAAFTGARLGDLCDLKKENFVKIGEPGIWCISIGNNKTGDVDRFVPIHSQLIALGLLDWIETLPKNGKLFSVTKRGDGGQYDYKWYGRQARKYITDPQKVFHSWRATVSSRLNNAGVTATHRADIIGHERKTDVETDRGYTTMTEVLALKNDLELLQYPVDWSKVKIK